MSKNATTDPVLDRIVLRSIAARFKAGDRLVLTDAVLIDALEGKTPLSRIEYSTLMDSPLTLRRAFALLDLRRKKRLMHPAQPLTASNDSKWLPVQLTRRKQADSGNTALSWQSEDGCWTLDIRRKQQGWQMILSGQAAVADEIAVLDHRGSTLMSGMLDDENQLWGNWPSAEAPENSLNEHGFRVERI